MSRKSIFILVGAACAVSLGIAVAILILYFTGTTSSATSGNGKELFEAIPEDAVCVAHFDDLQTLTSMYVGEASPLPESGDFSRFLQKTGRAIGARRVENLKNSEVALSFHQYSSLTPLLIVDVDQSGAGMQEDLRLLCSIADSCKLKYERVDGGKVVKSKDSYLFSRQFLLVSTSGVTMNSSKLHLAEGSSILDNKDFSGTMTSSGCTQIYLKNSAASKILPQFFVDKVSRHADFLSRVSSWTRIYFERLSPKSIYLGGAPSADQGQQYFANYFKAVSPSEAKVAEILPSYAVSAYSLPLNNAKTAFDAYSRFAQTLPDQVKRQWNTTNVLEKSRTTAQKWLEKLDVKEIARASFFVGSRLETVLLLRLGKPDMQYLFNGTGLTSFKNYTPNLHAYSYKGVAGVCFGDFFAIDDESHFTYINGWAVIGPKTAVEEYVSGTALQTTLSRRMASAGNSSLTGGSNVHFLAYLSLVEEPGVPAKVFKRKYADFASAACADVAFCPMVFKVFGNGNSLGYSLTCNEMAEVAPEEAIYERDTLITVPKGPFPVENLQTGKMCSFYQRPNMYLCLNNEAGNGLWGIEFHKPLCGRVETIDYFANGRSQMIFASGSKIYLLDFTGKYVSKFPVDLKKEVLLGPDAYDFNGTKAYNVMILHKDNTIEMYNLKGERPSKWKTITSNEKIKGLPQAVKVSGKTWWIVRTSMQTLVYPFYGGEPVATYKGNARIRPDSAVEVLEGKIRMTRYDGKTATINLN